MDSSLMAVERGPGSVGRGAVPPRVSAILREVAAGLEGQADDLAATMVEAYKAEIPAYGQISDPALFDDVRAVSGAVVRCWLTVMSSGSPVPDVALGPLLEGSRRRADQGIELESLLRAYRIGIRVMWSEITGSPVWRRRPLQGALAQVATWVLDFADHMSTGVAAAYMDEAAKVARRREHLRSAMLNAILAGPGSDRLEGPDELAAQHCVVVARVPTRLSPVELESVGEALQERVAAVLWTIRHGSVVAAVPATGLSYRHRLQADLGRMLDSGDIVAFGIGDRAEGAAETRYSYAEAVEALRIGPHLDADRPADQPAVYDYQDLAPLASLLADPGRARRLVAEILEPLGDLVRRDWTLPTLEAYLLHQGHLKVVAAALEVHQSTVKYRMNELRPALGPALERGDRAAQLLLAIRLQRLLAPDAGGSNPRPPAAPGRPGRGR